MTAAQQLRDWPGFAASRRHPKVRACGRSPQNPPPRETMGANHRLLLQRRGQDPGKGTRPLDTHHCPLLVTRGRQGTMSCIVMHGFQRSDESTLLYDRLSRKACAGAEKRTVSRSGQAVIYCTTGSPGKRPTRGRKARPRVQVRVGHTVVYGPYDGPHIDPEKSANLN